MRESHGYIERMRKKGIIITPYLDPEIVERVYASMGQPPPGKEGGKGDGIEEDIREEF